MQQEQQFIVYATDSPVFKDSVFGVPCGDNQADQIHYGKGTIISGGTMQLSTEAKRPHITLDGCIGLNDNRLIESVLTQVIPPHFYVTLLYQQTKSWYPDWQQAAEESGFVVKKIANTLVCVGQGESLMRFQWMQGIYSCSYFALFAAKDPLDKLVALMTEHPPNCFRDLSEVIDNYWKSLSCCRDRVGSNDLDFVYAGLCDPDGSNIFVCTNDAINSKLEVAIEAGAKQYSVALFDAGSIEPRDEAGHSFNVFYEWLTPKPLPKHWRRIE